MTSPGFYPVSRLFGNRVVEPCLEQEDGEQCGQCHADRRGPGAHTSVSKVFWRGKIPLHWATGLKEKENLASVSFLE